MRYEESLPYLILFIVIFCIGLFFVFFFFSLIRYQKRYYALHKQLISAEILSQEKERKRIAADLHDDVGQMLALSKIQLMSVNSTHAGQQKMLTDIADQIESVLTKMKLLCEQLAPQILTQKGLGAAICSHLNALKRLNVIVIKYNVNRDLRLKKIESEIHLFRIFQEVTTNTLKHANASCLLINLAQSATQTTLSISDDGKGFNKSQLPSLHTGMGLKNIENRVAILNGGVIVHSNVGEGVRYSITIPNE